jgi:hypothetical protein
MKKQLAIASIIAIAMTSSMVSVLGAGTAIVTNLAKI